LHYKLTGKEFNTLKLQDIRSVSGIKEIPIKIGSKEFKVILVNGLTGIEKLMEGIINKTINAHFIEIMACPGGCVNGGGQPFKAGDKDLKSRIRAIYEIDEVDTIKASHKNPLVNDLYEKFLEKPGSDKAKQQLHTCYTKRDVLL